MYGRVPHQLIGQAKKGSKSNRFCPLADDHNMLKNYLLERKRKEGGRTIKWKESKKGIVEVEKNKIMK